MRKLAVSVATVAALLATAASAHAALVPVNSLTAPFGATNPSVRWTPQGVNYGVYADAAAAGGSLEYDGLNGAMLGSLSALGYTYNYNTSDDDAGQPEVGRLAAPYLRVFLDTDVNNDTFDDDVIFDPTLCGTVSPAENTDIAADVAASQVRFNNDDGGADCANTQGSFADVRAAHADAHITGIFITQGFSGGHNASAFVRNLTANGSTFAFDVPPTAGPPGAAGTTRVVQVPVNVPVNKVAGTQAQRSCKGNTLRRVRAPRRKGEKFLRVNAALRTASGFRALKVKGRTVTVDLRNRSEANYNVRLIVRYRTKSGKIQRVVTRRNLSVACS
jgi:hypothetical protein